MAKTPSITLYRDTGAKGVFPWSPFVAKLETRLRFAGLPYDIALGSLSESPKGKLPYIKLSDSDQTTLISDTKLITTSLIHDDTIEDINATLSPAQKAFDLAIQALLEEKIYWLNGQERWLENFYVMRDIGPLSPIPFPIRFFVGYIVHAKATRTMHGQGVGRFSEEEKNEMRSEYWSSLDALVAESARQQRDRKGIPWVLGREQGPSEADAVLFGFLASTLICPGNPKAKKVVKGLPHLMEYADKVYEAYFPDYEKWT